MQKIAVLIPCFNESATIAKVVEDFQVQFPKAAVYVYDNNSTDGSDALARQAGATVRYVRQQGKGNVIRSMFRDIDADCYIMVDGDDTYPAEAAPALAKAVLKGGADMVIGDRLSTTYGTQNKRAFHQMGNHFVRKLINRIFKGNLTDIMTGYRAFSFDFVKSFPVLSQGFEIETEMTIHALDKNLSIDSIPVDYRDRPEGSLSKLNTFSDGRRVIGTVFRLYKDYKPLSFFSILAAVLLAVAVVLFVPILIDYLGTGLVPRLPTLVVSVFLALMAVQSFAGGLILDTQGKKSKQNFELQRNIIRLLYGRKSEDDQF